MATVLVPPNGGVTLGTGLPDDYTFAGSVAHWYEVTLNISAGFSNISFDGDPGPALLRVRAGQQYRARVKTKFITVDPNGTNVGWLAWARQ